MRQGQQHRRGRSRGSSGGGNGSSHGHHHRKGQNPLARSFESNGPDVKVRGTAADIAGKYITLARDAQSSGDPVLAENYLQHAEHYNRMIIAYREQQMQQGGDAANGHRQRQPQGLDLGEGGEDADGEGVDPGMAEQPSIPAFARHPGQETQPRQENGRHENGRQDERRPSGRQQDNRSERGDSPRFRDRRYDRPDYRGERTERTAERTERTERTAERTERTERTERNEANEEPRAAREPAPAEQPQPQPVIEAGETAPRESREAREPAATPAAARRRERFDMMKDQPEFLRRPVRRPRREEPPAEKEPSSDGAQEKSGA